MDAITLRRHTYTDKSTVGDLLIYGGFHCHVLEDTSRKDGIKVYGQTCIPRGRYQVVVNQSARFGRMMPLLVNVPGFEGVRIHSGNTEKDTLGCLLVGKYDPAHPDFIYESRSTFDTFFEKFESINELVPTINIIGGRYIDQPPEFTG